MSPLRSFALAAVLLLPATAALAVDDGLTNGPDGKLPNTPGSALGFDGINAVAPERELLYHPNGTAGAATARQAEPNLGDAASEPVATLRHRHLRHRRHHGLPR